MSDKIEPFIILTKYFFEHFSHDLLLGKKSPSTRSEEIIFEVFTRINDVSSIFYRLQKYPIYFTKLYFIDDEEISKAETIEYHIQNYLNDIYSFKVKMERILGLLKNNIREFNIENENDIRGAIEHIKNNLDKTLSKVQKIRGDHMHDISISDSKIVKAKLNQLMVNFVNINKIEYADKDNLIIDYNKLIDELKDSYKKKSEDNMVKFEELFNFFISRIGFLLASLYGHNTEEFVNILNTN